MPFEGDVADFTRITPPAIETPAQRVIRRARALVADSERWTKNYRVGDSFCVLGALREAHHGDAWRPGTGGAQDVVMRVLKRLGYTGITTFNDRNASHGQVLAVLDAAYELAGKPKGAKLKLSRSLLRAYFGRDLLTREPLPPPVHIGADRPTVADIVCRISAEHAAAQVRVLRVESRTAAAPIARRWRAFGEAFDTALLSALRWVS